jgi:thymidine phosphorylase
MSKKIAEGSDALVLDVKCGDGAFVQDEAQARTLAEAMVAVGNRSGLRTEAFVTDMNAPLGRAIGNSIEIMECLEVLKARGPSDVTEIVVGLAVRMLMLGGAEQDSLAATRRVWDGLASGRGLETFARMIERQGGDARVVDDYKLLPAASRIERLEAPRSGCMTTLSARAIGRASHALGAGRSSVGERIDHGVGIMLKAKPGDEVQRGQPLLELHTRDGRGVETALALCREAFVIADTPQPRRPRILWEFR